MKRDEVEHAKNSFLRAAAALTEARTKETIAFALVEGSAGLLALAEYDKGERGKQLALAFLEERMDE
jgi:hypothetical protein